MESATTADLRKFLLSKTFVIKNANKDSFVKEAISNTGDIVLKIKKTKFVIYKIGFMNYQWLVRIMYAGTKNETDIAVEFADDSRKQFDLIAKTIQVYSK